MSFTGAKIFIKSFLREVTHIEQIFRYPDSKWPNSFDIFGKVPFRVLFRSCH